MDTSKYIKRCPRCGTDIEPDRYATKGDKAFGGVTSVSGALIGATFGGPVGATIGGVAGYFAGKATIMSIENDHDMNQSFKYKCPNSKCGCEWKEIFHINDDSDDTSWMQNAPFNYNCLS